MQAYCTLTQQGNLELFMQIADSRNNMNRNCRTRDVAVSGNYDLARPVVGPWSALLPVGAQLADKASGEARRAREETVSMVRAR